MEVILTIIPVIVALLIIALIPAIVADIVRKKFVFSKWVIIFAVGLLLLSFILIFAANLFGISTTSLTPPILQ